LGARGAQEQQGHDADGSTGGVGVSPRRRCVRRGRGTSAASGLGWTSGRSGRDDADDDASLRSPVAGRPLVNADSTGRRWRRLRRPFAPLAFAPRQPDGSRAAAAPLRSFPFAPRQPDGRRSTGAAAAASRTAAGQRGGVGGGCGGPLLPFLFAPGQPDGSWAAAAALRSPCLRSPAAGRQPGGGAAAPSLPFLRSTAAGLPPVNGGGGGGEPDCRRSTGRRWRRLRRPFAPLQVLELCLIIVRIMSVNLIPAYCSLAQLNGPTQPCFTRRYDGRHRH
jgi:hypothetical protein